MKALLCLPLLFALACHGGNIEGRVVAIADGDTLTVLDADMNQHRIRLAAIDAPEKRQPFGTRAKESLSDLVYSKIVSVQTGKKDRYGREIGKVLVDGVDANLLQVQRGFAWHFKAYEREQSPADRQLYDVAQSEAKAAGCGLCRDAEPVAPWEWRKGRRE